MECTKQESQLKSILEYSTTMYSNADYSGVYIEYRIDILG